MNCTFCTLEINEQPMSTLLCGHACHTICLLRNGLSDNFERYRCKTCDMKIVPDELIAEVYGGEDQGAIDIKNLIANSEGFNNACKNAIVLYKNHRKNDNLLTKAMRPITNIYKTNVKPQLSILKNYIKSKRKEIVDLNIYKETIKTQNSLSRSINQMALDFNLNRYDLSRHLATLAKTTRRSLYRYNLSMKLNRIFRIRV